MSVDFNKENDGVTLIKYSSEVCLKALPKTLPSIIAILAILCLINYLPQWIPAAYQEDASLGIMFAYIAILPLVGMIFSITDATAKKINQSTTDLLVQTVGRMLSFFGCLISMCLLPVIIFAAGFVVSMLSMQYSVDARIIFFLQLFFYFLMFLSILAKVYAPIMTITDKMDTNTALDTSTAASKGYFVRNLFYIGFGFTLLLGVISLPNFIHYYLPFMQIGWPQWAPVAISAVLLLFSFLWVAAILVCHKIDLLYRYNNKKQAEEQNKKTNFAYEHKIKKAGTDKVGTQDQVPPTDSDVGF